MDNQKLSNGFKNVYNILKIFRIAKEDNWQIFVDELNKIDKSLLDKQIEYYNKDNEKVKKIRIDILNKLKKWNISLSDVEEIKEQEKKNYDYNILKSWTNFSILYSLFYFYHKETINTFFTELNEELIEDLWIKNDVDIKVIGFEWAQNFWLDGFWTAIYHNSHKSQKTALQMNIDACKKDLWVNKIAIWIWHWPEYHWWIESKREVFDINELTYKNILEEFKKYKDLILNDKFDNENEMYLLKDIITKFIKRSFEWKVMSIKDILENKPKYKWLWIKMSFWMGSFAKITRMSFLKQGEKTSDWIYPAILFKRDSNELVIAYWISETNIPKNDWGSLNKNTIWSELLRDKYSNSFIEKIFRIDEDNFEEIIENMISSLNIVIDKYNGVDKNFEWPHYRLYAPWENARKREEYYEKGVMWLGWDELWDLNQYKSKEDIAERLRWIDGSTGSKKNDANANYEFKNVLAIGDIVIPKKWQKTYLGYGIVEWEYIYDDTLDEYKSIRKVRRIKKWEREEDGDIVLKTLTDITKYPEYVEKLKKLIWIDVETTFTSPINTIMTWWHKDLNTILYWAPWTGKTYNTINYSLSIIENKSLDEINKEDREQLKKRFDEYKKQGQIVFCTFHQSLSYEEFIEWIRANSDNGSISYDIGNGIFKNIANQASKNEFSAKIGLDIDIDDLLQQFGDLISNDLENWNKVILKDWATIWKITYNENGQLKSFVTGWAVNNQRLTINIIKRDYPNYRKWLIKSYQDIQPAFDSESKWHGNARYYISLYEKLQEFERSKSFVKKEIEKEEQKNYVLIIDEINRGNMSKIFWELITLLEPSKRIGAEEELKVKLPYSQDEFGVPQNLYVVWTMNTADRSIALIDIALRRRFTFKEIESDSSLLNFKVWNIDIQKMFETINERIEFLYDRDHKLGHSFFMPLKKNNSLNHLNEIFYNNIIPLLQEYFYEDREKIQIVLGDHTKQGNKKMENKLIQEENQNEVKIIGFNHEDLEDKSKYAINTNPTEKSYLWIYSKTIDEKAE